MSTLPAAGTWEDDNLTEAAAKTWGEDIRDVIAELLGGSAQSDKTIAAGTFTADRAVHRVDTEAAAATDDLDTVSVANMPDGRVMVLRPVSAARVTTIKHGNGASGGFLLADQQDYVMDDVDEWIAFVAVSAKWVELMRSRANRPAIVIDTTAAVGSPYALKHSQNGAYVTNRAAVASVGVQLPAAAPGMVFFFFVVAAQAIRALLAGGDSVRDGASTNTGYAEIANVAGNYMVMRCLDTTEWWVMQKQGTVTLG